MEAKNLRIGNFVSDANASDSFFAKVKKLDYSRCYYGQFHSAYSDLKPIPLTKEWLDRFGFVKDNNGNYWIDLQTHYLELMPSNGYWYPTYAQVAEMSHEEEQRVSTNGIKFVHELQNLFFALTGQELELKTN